MTGLSTFLSFVFLALFGRKQVDERDRHRACRFLSAALEEKKLNAERLAPRLQIDPRELQKPVLDSLVSEAAARAAKKEEDGIARWRSLFPELIAIADAVDDTLRGQITSDDRVRAVLQLHRV